MKTSNKPLSWKPRRQGHIYCSPACGGGCTTEEYELAVKNATILSKKLGPSWEPRVWENLGWHYEAICDNSSVSPSGKRYWASISVGRQFMAYDKNPRKAFLKALEACDSAIEMWKNGLDLLKQK